MSRNIAKTLGVVALVLFVLITGNAWMFLAGDEVIPIPIAELLLSGAIVMAVTYWNYRIGRMMRRSRKEQIAIIQEAVGEIVRVEIDAAIGRMLRLSDLAGISPEVTPPPKVAPKPYPHIVRARQGD